jgi:hypothetical protein
VLGTPTYTVFAGGLAAVDAELIRQGRMHDLREPGTEPRLEKKSGVVGGPHPERAEAIMRTVIETLEAVSRSGRGRRPPPPRPAAR